MIHLLEAAITKPLFAMERVQWWVFVATLCTIPFLVFRRTRAWAAAILLYSSLFWGLLLWFQAAAFLAMNAGWAWLISGMIFFVLGIVPLAFIYALFHADWTSVVMILGDIAWIWGTRYAAAKCMSSVIRE